MICIKIRRKRGIILLIQEGSEFHDERVLEALDESINWMCVMGQVILYFIHDGLELSG